MASSTLVSLGEYLSTTYEFECEFVDGEIVERNIGEIDHGALQTVFVSWLFNQRKQVGIHVFTET